MEDCASERQLHDRVVRTCDRYGILYDADRVELLDEPPEPRTVIFEVALVLAVTLTIALVANLLIR
jgi:hypothetical protein